MAITVTIDGVSYSYPERNEKGWGAAATNVIEAICNKLNEISSSADIAVSSFTLANNQVSAADITGLSFDISTMRGALAIYSIYRTTGSAERSEEGQLEVKYNNVANTWDISQTAIGASGILFTITAAGQVQYTSDNYASGVLKFRAFVQPQ